MRLGLVLSGGGANGAFGAGVVGAIEEAGLRPTVLSGTSAGALTAAGMAVGMDAAHLAELWRSVRSSDVHRLRHDVWRLFRPRGLLSRGNLGARTLESIGWTWLLETAPLRMTLERALDGERVDVREGLVLAISAVERATGELVRFASATPPPHRLTPRFRVGQITVEHLLASASIPIVFQPTDVEGVPFWDGGILSNTPLAPAMAYEPDAIIVVTSATRARPAPPPESLAQAVGLLVDNILAHSLAADVERARLINQLCRQDPGGTELKEVELLVIEATGLDLGGALDFSPARAERRVRLGLDAGRRALAGWDPPAAT